MDKWFGQQAVYRVSMGNFVSPGLGLLTDVVGNGMLLGRDLVPRND